MFFSHTHTQTNTRKKGTDSFHENRSDLNSYPNDDGHLAIIVFFQIFPKWNLIDHIRMKQNKKWPLSLSLTLYVPK